MFAQNSEIVGFEHKVKSFEYNLVNLVKQNGYFMIKG